MDSTDPGFSSYTDGSILGQHVDATGVTPVIRGGLLQNHRHIWDDDPGLIYDPPRENPQNVACIICDQPRGEQP